MNKITFSEIAEKKAENAPLSRSEQKRIAILEAANAAFMDKGFLATSMDYIAKQANVSKRTVYNHFGSKEDLFAGILTTLCATTSLTTQQRISPDMDVTESLQIVGEEFLRLIFDPETMALMRVLVMEGQSFPEIARTFFKHGPENFIIGVGQQLLAWQEKGAIKIADPERTAAAFLASLYQERFISCLVAALPLPTEQEREDMVRLGVSMFLNGVCVRKAITPDSV